MITKIVWQPLLLAGGAEGGLALDSSFADECFKRPLLPAERQSLEQYVWRFTQPDGWDKGYQPSDFFTYMLNKQGEPTWLLSAVYIRHYASDGKWLTHDGHSVLDDWPHCYHYHHSRDEIDHHANRWLRFAFHWWTEWVLRKLENR